MALRGTSFVINGYRKDRDDSGANFSKVREWVLRPDQGRSQMNQEAVDKLFDKAKKALAYANEATPYDHDQALQESMAYSLLLIADALQNQIIYMKDSDRV